MQADSGDVAPTLADEPQQDDERWMQRALRLAVRGEGYVEPNPMVGCVLVRDGRLIGEGHHAQYGGPHAEIVALRDCRSRDVDPHGATAYVTLEPCCHRGKTPPCSQALINAGITRVVVAVQDPFGSVNGGGFRELRDAGIAVTVGVAAEQAGEVLAPFAKRVRTGLPWVIAKWAMTADGRIATTIGQSQWITGEASRQDVHRIRGRVDAIVVGMGTVMADDPMLTARPPGPRVARRVVVCREHLPEKETNLVRTARQYPTIVVAPPSLAAVQQADLAASGVQLMGCDPADSAGSLRRMLQQSATAGATNVLLECGGRLMSSFFEADLIDEFHVYVGALAVGGSGAPGPLGGIGKPELADATRLKVCEVRQIDHDAKIIYRRM